MINGDPKEFIDGLHYGDERFFMFSGRKYFVQGYFEGGKPMLILYIFEPEEEFGCVWKAFSSDENYPVDAFEKAKVFNGKSFWEVEGEIQWVDCRWFCSSTLGKKPEGS